YSSNIPTINILIISMIEIDVYGNQTHQSGEEPIQVMRKFNSSLLLASSMRIKKGAFDSSFLVMP
ncbi:hypothetical protein, partial [Vibrio diazotrophicus]|uniref:hypothetical protein n=1 Tax=Vibrio diazotrophicus TaxID=685 RepID=UPI000CBA4003